MSFDVDEPEPRGLARYGPVGDDTDEFVFDEEQEPEVFPSCGDVTDGLFFVANEFELGLLVLGRRTFGDDADEFGFNDVEQEPGGKLKRGDETDGLSFGVDEPPQGLARYGLVGLVARLFSRCEDVKDELFFDADVFGLGFLGREKFGADADGVRFDDVERDLGGKPKDADNELGARYLGR